MNRNLQSNSAISPTRTPRRRKMVVGLAAALALVGLQTHASAHITLVTSCVDDSSPGTLRQVVANAASGDQIDLSNLTCPDSTITLTQGEVVVPTSVSLVGPSDRTLTIAGSNDRVFYSAAAAPAGFLSIANLTIAGGRVYTQGSDAEGGCILAASNVTLINSEVADCVARTSGASARGGAIKAQSVSLQASLVTGGDARTAADQQDARGGGIYTASLSCTDGTLSGNRAVAASASDYGKGGGAFIAGGSIGLLRCTIDTNQAGEAGGIAQFVSAGTSSSTTVESSTISGNASTNSFGGFELFCPKCSPPTLQMNNSTVAFNSSASDNAGIFTNGDIVAQSSIIASNRSGQAGADADLTANSLSGANNLVVSTSTPASAGAITSTSDPKLAPLSNRDGPTRTHALSMGSPARGIGNNVAALTTDQRGPGFQRVVNGSVDVGAYQRQVNDDEVFGAGMD